MAFVLFNFTSETLYVNHLNKNSHRNCSRYDTFSFILSEGIDFICLHRNHYAYWEHFQQCTCSTTKCSNYVKCIIHLSWWIFLQHKIVNPSILLWQKSHKYKIVNRSILLWQKSDKHKILNTVILLWQKSDKHKISSL